jgi:ADP-heptose:LPS heptosyltransferase
MKIKLMRQIDWYVGVPLCYFLTAVKKIKDLFNKKNNGEIKKILVIKFLGIGSIILASPTLDALKDKFPNAEIYFLSFKSNEDILNLLNQTDKNYFISTNGILDFIFSTFKNVLMLRKEKIDLTIDLEFFAKFPLVLSYLINAKKKAGFYLILEPWRKALLDYHGYYNHYYHVKDIFLSLVYLIREKDPYYINFEEYGNFYKLKKFLIEEELKAKIRHKLKECGWQEGQEVILINPNASQDLATNVRKWPEKNFAKLTEEIIKFYPNSIVFYIGSKTEYRASEKIINNVSSVYFDKVVNFSGQSNLVELIALFSISNVFITIDSGPAHLASLTNIPIVDLFFADTPILFAPLTDKKEIIFSDLYSVPLYTVYSGKDPHVTENKAACTIQYQEVFAAVKKLKDEEFEMQNLKDEEYEMHNL